MTDSAEPTKLQLEDLEKSLGELEVHDFMILQSIDKWIEILSQQAIELDDEYAKLVAAVEADIDDVSPNHLAQARIELELLYRSIAKWRIFAALTRKGSSQKKAFEEAELAASGKRKSFKDFTSK